MKVYGTAVINVHQVKQLAAQVMFFPSDDEIYRWWFHRARVHGPGNHRADDRSRRVAKATIEQSTFPRNCRYFALFLLPARGSPLGLTFFPIAGSIFSGATSDLFDMALRVLSPMLLLPTLQVVRNATLDDLVPDLVVVLINIAIGHVLASYLDAKRKGEATEAGSLTSLGSPD